MKENEGSKTRKLSYKEVVLYNGLVEGLSPEEIAKVVAEDFIFDK